MTFARPHAKASGPFIEKTVDQLTIGGEPAFRAIPLYSDLKEVLRKARYVFRVLPASSKRRWDRALFLNLTYWSGAGGDVLDEGRVPADVVAHAAWHHLAVGALGDARGAAESPAALFLGESIASAFDVYLVGRLLARGGASTFLETQVPAMAKTAKAAGLSAHKFESLLGGIAKDPERAFAELRELLYDAACALLASRGAAEAFSALRVLEKRRLAVLLHHYELSNWVLFARSRLRKTRRAAVAAARARRVDGWLRRPLPLAWLASEWVAPALGGRSWRS